LGFVGFCFGIGIDNYKELLFGCTEGNPAIGVLRVGSHALERTAEHDDSARWFAGVRTVGCEHLRGCPRGWIAARRSLVNKDVDAKPTGRACFRTGA
jgi:hypothetical protein